MCVTWNFLGIEYFIPVEIYPNFRRMTTWETKFILSPLTVTYNRKRNSILSPLHQPFSMCHSSSRLRYICEQNQKAYSLMLVTISPSASAQGSAGFKVQHHYVLSVTLGSHFSLFNPHTRPPSNHVVMSSFFGVSQKSSIALIL